jgi:nucleoid-associated protein YgaU
MHGRTGGLILSLATGISLAGCVVHNHPPAPPATAEPQQQQPQQKKPTAQAVKPAPAPAAPATRSVVVPAPAPQPAATSRTYTIKPGDNLWNISKEVYGDGTKYQRILDANPGLNPDNMKPGTKIVIP